MSYPPPTGRESGPPEGLDRNERFRWWIDWRLAHAAENNATSPLADPRVYFLEHPSRPCIACTHGDVFEFRTGQRHTCRICHGLMRVPLTVDEMRVEYRAIRRRVVEASYASAQTIGEDDFDARIARKLARPDLPGYWLAAARAAERDLERERAERRRAARGAW